MIAGGKDKVCGALAGVAFPHRFHPMCTAYELGKRGGSFPERLRAEAVDGLLKITGSSLIRPTLAAPVILPDGSLREMSWGFRRQFAAKVKGRKSVTRTIVNSREDKLDGRTWKEAFTERRCLIPAASFYEWVERDGRKFPLRFGDAKGEWLWLAGIWEESKEHGECFSMITTEPNAVMEPVHDRMPAVLTHAQIAPYLEGEFHGFGPSAVPLEFQKAVNFLKAKKPETGELF
jgi:putative SOS response-associated peptidase YedK